MNRIISILIIMGGIVGGYFVYQDYAKGVKATSNHWADDLRTVIKAYIKDANASSGDVPGNSNSMPYYRMLGLIYDSEQHHYFAGDTVRGALSGSGLPPGQAKMVIDSLLDNYHAAKQLGVFEVTANLLRLERGEPPLCSAKGWDGELLVPGYVISPLLAPEAAYALPNVVMMPKTVRDLQNEQPAGLTTDIARKWLLEHLILPASQAAINAALTDKKL